MIEYSVQLEFTIVSSKYLPMSKLKCFFDEHGEEILENIGDGFENYVRVTVANTHISENGKRYDCEDDEECESEELAD
jgi:hypothetical protein